MILIGNGPLITRDPKRPWINPGGVIIEGNEIIAVGSWEDMRDYYHHNRSKGPDENKVMDVAGKIIMPGLINAHHHIYSAFARGMAPTLGPKEHFLDILENVWWRLDANLDAQSSYYSGIVTYMECIRNGVTTVVDHHASYGEIKGSLKALLDSAKVTGLRTALAYEISDRHGEKACHKAIEESYHFLDSLKKEDSHKVAGMVGLHASFTLSDKTLSKIKHKGMPGKGYHIHVAEGVEDEIQCQKNHGCSVVRRLYDENILNENTLAGHAIHVSEEDLELINMSGASVVHNPSSNMANGVGAADVVKMMEKGILVGLGTDGYTSDMLESLKVANMLQKHLHMRGDVGFAEAITMLFDNNASLASRLFDASIGTLKPGALADVVVMDYHPTTPLTEDNYNGHIMFGMNGSMTDTVVADGLILYQNRKFTSLDEETLLAQARECAEQVWRAMYE